MVSIMVYGLLNFYGLFLEYFITSVMCSVAAIITACCCCCFCWFWCCYYHDCCCCVPHMNECLAIVVATRH